MKEVVYIGELDQDVDDFVAALYLQKHEVLKCIVLDPFPKTNEGKERMEQLKNLGIEIRTSMPPVAKYVFVGGGLTLLSNYLILHKIDVLVMNGGFVGCNIAKEILPKFQDKETIKTFNFNLDVNATDKVLQSKNIGEIILVGKNVCHDRRNTKLGIWKNENILEEYHIKDKKLQHDMLACHEGLVFCNMIKDNLYCVFEELKPYNTGLNGRNTLWGSTKNDSPYRTAKVAIAYAKPL